jgi:hypothetical protein
VADSSFDIVNKLDRQEADNALNQAAKELAQRFDFRGTGTGGRRGHMEITSSTGPRPGGAGGACKWVKRSLSLKSLAGRPARLRQEYRSRFARVGHHAGAGQKVSNHHDEGPKSVKAQVMGDELRVTGKSRDDLQAVQALVRGADLDFAVQFDNYR